MRELKFTDVFTVSRILKKMNIRAEFQAAMSAQQVGIVLMQQVMESLGEAEKEVTAFLADMKGIKESEIKKLTLDETFDLIEEFRSQPQLTSFFARVSKLM
jgi:hypothetical protein